MPALVYAATTGLALATLATFLWDEWWVFDVASHFRPHYVAAALVLLAVALLHRLRRTAALVFMLGLPHAASLENMVVPSARAIEAAAPGSTSLRLTTLNVQWRNATKDAVVDYVRRVRPDVLVVQEAVGSWWRQLPALGAMFPYAGPAGWARGARVHLFSRHPIRDLRTHTPQGRYFPYLVARLEVDGRPLTVIAVHAPRPKGAHLSRIRNAYLRDVAKTARGIHGPLIVAGDFNLTPWSGHYRDFVRETGLANVSDGRGWMATWPTWLTPAALAIDFILVSDGVVARGVKRGPQIGSDHYPITADLEILMGR